MSSGAYLQEAALRAVERDGLGREEVKLDDLDPPRQQAVLERLSRAALRHHYRRHGGDVPQVGVLRWPAFMKDALTYPYMLSCLDMNYLCKTNIISVS